MITIVPVSGPGLPDLKIFTNLNETQLMHYHEPMYGLFIAESPNAVLRALSAEYEPVCMLMEERCVDTIGRKILDKLQQSEYDVPVYTAGLDILQQITGYHLTRGILCAFRRRALPSPEEICQTASRIAVLEHVENPTNVGAVIRSAAALGMDAVLLTDGCADPLQRRAIRVSVGTVFQIPWTYLGQVKKTYAWVREEEPQMNLYGFDDHSWPQRGMAQLNRLGFRTAAMCLDENSIRIDDPRLSAEPKLAVLLGNEGDGLSQQTIASCDYTVKIPMAHGVDSLNVAAASAVAFWALRKPSSDGLPSV